MHSWFVLVATTCQIAIMSFASVSFYSQHIHNKFFSRLRLYFYFSSSLCSILYYHTPYRFVQIICVLFVVAVGNGHTYPNICVMYSVCLLYFFFFYFPHSLVCVSLCWFAMKWCTYAQSIFLNAHLLFFFSYWFFVAKP